MGHQGIEMVKNLSMEGYWILGIVWVIDPYIQDSTLHHDSGQDFARGEREFGNAPYDN